MVDVFDNLFTGGGNNTLTLAPAVPPRTSSSTRTQPTTFDQVYSGPRRRPAMISLNVQWVPTERSGAYQWSEGDENTQKVKTVTYFGTGEMRGQEQAKTITPPDSDYTDAYLSAFASKPIPTRHIHQIGTSVFANSAPIPLKPTSASLSTSSSMKTSETRFVNNNNNIQTSNSFDKHISPSSSRSSFYSPSFAPEKATTYEPFSSTQYSSPQSQTYTSSYSTLLRTPSSTVITAPSPSIDNQRSYTTFQTRSQPSPPTLPTVYRSQPSPPTLPTVYRSQPSPSTISTLYGSQSSQSTFPTVYRSQPSPSTISTLYGSQSSQSTFPTVYRSQTSYESIYKPLPAYSIQSYPPSNTYTTSLSSPTIESAYKPYVPFQTAPLSSLYNINQSSTSERTVQSTSKVEKQSERPETLLFQHDDDIRTSGIEKPSPVFTPSPESPITREEYKVEAERLDTNDLSTTISEPIRILENTLNRYDSLLDQISDVLASVSPLSSTVSSMSPGKSALDYQLSSDSSPILQHRRVESQTSQQATATAKSSSTQQTKPGHLIREDSYDKIVTAISDLDTGTISPSDDHKFSAAIKEEKDETTTPSIDDVPASLTTEKTESNTLSQDEHQRQLGTEQEKEEVSISSIPQEEKEEVKTSSSDEHQTSPIIEKEKEEIQPTSTEEHEGQSVTEEETKSSVLADSQTSPLTEEQKEEETKVLSADEQQTSSITEEETKDETKTASLDEHQVPLITKEDKEEELKTSFIDEVQTTTASEEEKKDETTTISTDEHPTTSFVEEKKEETNVQSSGEHQLKLTSEEEKVEAETTLEEQHQISSTTEEKKIESLDEGQIPSTAQEENEATKIPLTDVQQTLSVSEEPQVLSAAIPSDTVASEKSESSESKFDEEKVVDTTSETAEFVQQQTGLLTNVPNDAPVTEEPTQTPDDASSAKRTGKRVTWDEAVVDNEDDESSSHQSLVEESSTSDAPIITISEENNISPTTEKEDLAAEKPETVVDEQITSSDNSKSQVTSDETINPPTSIEPSAALSSTADQQVTAPDSADLQITSTEKQLSSVNDSEEQTNLQAATHDQQLIQSDSTDQQSNLTESKQDTSTVDQISSTSSDVVSKEDISKPAEESESKDEVTIDQSKVDTSSPAVENIPHESETTVTESTTSSLQPTIVSPVDTVADTVANRFISSDVYHGYLGDHKQFLPDVSDIDDENTTKSLLASLRETITTPITPLIESIQNVVSSMQTTTPTHPLTTENEVTDHPQDETKLGTALAEESHDQVSDDKSQIEENKSVVDTSEESKTMFESLREAVTTITETIQTAVSNLQSNKEEVPSTSSTEQATTALEENVSIAAAELPSDTVTVSDEKTHDDSHKENEQRQSSLLDTIQEKISKTITSFTETIQNVVSTDTHTEDEQKGKQETVSAQSSPSEIAELTPAPSEQIDVTDQQETTTEEKLDENASTETKTTLEVIRDVITHPLATITEKIQSVISTSGSEHADQVPSDATESSTHTSKQTENSETQPSLELANATTNEQEAASTTEIENLESTESKSAFETLRNVITHPIDTITEKIQSIISSSTTDEVPSSEQQTSTTTIDQNKNEDLTSTQAESISETVQDVVSNTTDQTSSSQEKEQILTTQESELYSQDQIQGEQEPSSTTISSQISSNEKIIPKTESESDHITNAEIHDSVSYATNETTSDANQILIDTIRDLINDTINKVISDFNQNVIQTESISQEISSSDSGLTSPITVINAEDRSESSQSTINQETLTNEDDLPDSQTSISDVTWTNLVGETSSDEKHDQSLEETNELLNEVVHSSDNMTGEITEDKTILPNQTQTLPIIENITQQTLIAPQIDDTMQRSSTELESDSTLGVTEIEKVPSKSLTDLRESSPGNTEDDSLELIHALQGHSIIRSSTPLAQTQTTTTQPSVSTSTIGTSDDQIAQAPEISSSSTTTSSQITSSDRYVSYAIHEMGDSSQERLPAFPVAADIPIYQSIKSTSDENKDQQILSEPIVHTNLNVTKDDDLTELDATENLTSYSDDVLLQKLNASAPNRQENLDASSTDEDVDDENFNEMEHHDSSNFHRIADETSQQHSGLSGGYEQTYQRYDLSSNSSTSTKPQTDDIYMIPGYPGLWKPSADDGDDESTHSAVTNDADDEDENKHSAGTVKTRTIVRTTNPAKLQSFLQQHHDIKTQDIPIRPDSIDIFNRPLNEFSFDVSESDSFKTCASTINSSTVSKHQKQSDLLDKSLSEQQEHQISPEDQIILIRERERGVSLPVTMKIDCDDMALRLSNSTPIDAPLYSTTQTDLPSPSTHSEPMQKTTSSSRASTPSLSSNESEQQKLSSSSWLNTVNTITTTIQGPDGPLESRTTIHKSSKGPISIAECDVQGKFIIIENTSRSKSIALASWTIRQESDNENTLTFTFPDNCLLRPNQSLKVFTRSSESERRNGDLIASLLSSWHTGSNVVTTLINADGKDRATLTKKTLFS